MDEWMDRSISHTGIRPHILYVCVCQYMQINRNTPLRSQKWIRWGEKTMVWQKKVEIILMWSWRLAWLSVTVHQNAPQCSNPVLEKGMWVEGYVGRRACGCHSSQCNTRDCIAQGCLRYTKLVTALLLYSGIGYWSTVLIYEFIFYVCVLIFISVFIFMQVNFFTMKWLLRGLRDFAKIMRLSQQALKSYSQVLIGPWLLK